MQADSNGRMNLSEFDELWRVFTHWKVCVHCSLYSYHYEYMYCSVYRILYIIVQLLQYLLSQFCYYENFTALLQAALWQVHKAPARIFLVNP